MAALAGPVVVNVVAVEPVTAIVVGGAFCSAQPASANMIMARTNAAPRSIARTQATPRLKGASVLWLRLTDVHFRRLPSFLRVRLGPEFDPRMVSLYFAVTIRLGLQIPNFSYGTSVSELFPAVKAQAQEAEAAAWEVELPARGRRVLLSGPLRGPHADGSGGAADIARLVHLMLEQQIAFGLR
jgi:hypothetical protein